MRVFLALALVALVLGASGGAAAAAGGNAAGLRFFSYWAALTSFVALFIIYKGFLKRTRDLPVAPAPQGFCAACGTPHAGDAFCSGCGARVAPPAPTPAAATPPGGDAS